MSEIVFLVEAAPEGGYTARSLGHSIFAEANSLPALRLSVQDAVHCHFDGDQTFSPSLNFRVMNENQNKRHT